MFRVGILTILLALAVPAQAVTLDEVILDCDSVSISGTVEGDVPYVRVQVVTMQDMSHVLATEVFPVTDGEYLATLTFERQPTYTGLVMAVGEWDGEQYTQPAALMSVICRDRFEEPPEDTPLMATATFAPLPTILTPSPPTAMFTPTPFPPPTAFVLPQITPFPTVTPPPNPSTSEAWTHTSTLVEHGCTLPGGPQVGDSTQINLTLTRTPGGEAVTITYASGFSFVLYAAGEGSYVGSHGGAATIEVALTFISPTTYTAHEVVTHESGCVVRSAWGGTMR